MEATSGDPGVRALFDNLVRCETRLYNAVGEALRAAHDISTTQFEFLDYVGRHPEARVADLAATFAAGVGAVSKMADRLVARDLVRRVPHPADRRSSILHLTDAGSRLLSSAEVTFSERLRELLADSLDARQLTEAATTLGALRGALERQGAGTPVG